MRDLLYTVAFATLALQLLSPSDLSLNCISVIEEKSSSSGALYESEWKEGGAAIDGFINVTFVMNFIF